MCTVGKKAKTFYYLPKYQSVFDDNDILKSNKIMEPLNNKHMDSFFFFNFKKI